MVVALLKIVSFELGSENGRKHLLLLDLEASELQFHVLEVAHQHYEELQS